MKSLCVWLATVAILGCWPAAVSAEEFRIETIVYREGEPEPLSENLTLFDDHLVFDFMLKPDQSRFPQQIVIYNATEKRFVLLDTRSRVKTEIIESELLKILAALQSSSVVDKENEFLFFPSFEEKFDIGTNWLTLRSPRLTYRTRGERPANDAVLDMYYVFIDQFARLNATDPRRMPPFARLKLNGAIKKYGFIPSRVEMTLEPKQSTIKEPLKIFSEHVMMWELSDKDRQRIDSAKRYWMDFKTVGLAEFRGIETHGEPDE